MLDIMVDIETTGLDPSHSSIIQLSAVRFDLHTKQVHESMFNECLQEAPGRWWDESTRNWWTGPERWELYCDLTSRARPPQEVIKEFQQWVLNIITPSPVRFWSKPLSFDYPMVNSYFNQFEILFPFHYRHAKDLNSYIFGRGHDNIDEFWNGVEKVGVAHNALHDVLYQIRGAFQA